MQSQPLRSWLISRVAPRQNLENHRGWPFLAAFNYRKPSQMQAFPAQLGFPSHRLILGRTDSNITRTERPMPCTDQISSARTDFCAHVTILGRTGCSPARTDRFYGRGKGFLRARNGLWSARTHAAGIGGRVSGFPAEFSSIPVPWPARREIPW